MPCMLWQSIIDDDDDDCPQWYPAFLYCGPFDYKLQAFPILNKSSHQLWIPVEWKSAFRFLNHAIYCYWHASLDSRLPHVVRKGSLYMAKFGDRLRAGFLDEVVAYWYNPGTQLPTDDKPTRQDEPLYSGYLARFLINMFNKDTIVPSLAWVPHAQEPGIVFEDPTTFNWVKWVKKRPLNQAIYGSLPNVGSKEYNLMLAENKAARIPNAPSTEIDSSSWSLYTSEVLALKHLPENLPPWMCRSDAPPLPSHTAETNRSDRHPASEPEAKRLRRE